MRGNNDEQGPASDPNQTSLMPRTDPGQQVALYDPTLVGGPMDDETIDLKELWRVVVKRRWTIISVASIIVAAAILMTLLIIPEYRATTQLQINPPGNSQILAYEDFTAEQTRYQEYLNTQTQIMRSRGVVEAVVRNQDVADNPNLNGEVRQRNILAEIFGVFRLLTGSQRDTPEASELDPQAREQLTSSRVSAAASRLRSRVEVTPIQNSELVDLSVTGFDPDFAARMANAIAEEYARANMQRRIDAGAEARVFLEDQLADMRVALEQADQNLTDFAKDSNVADLDEREQAALNSLRRLSERQSEIQAELVQLRTWRELIEQGRVETLEPVVESPVILDLQRRLLDARSEYVSLSERFLDNFPDVQEVLSRIEGLEAEIEAQREVIISNISGRYENLVAQDNGLQNAIEEAERRILSLNERAVQYNILQREFETNRELYDGLLQRMKEIGVSAGVQENNIAMIDRARAPGGPFKPNLLRSLMLGLILGLMAGGGLAFLLEYLDGAIHRVEDIERIVDRPVMGVIPLVKSPTDRSSLLPFGLGQASEVPPSAEPDADRPAMGTTDDDAGIDPNDTAQIEAVTVAMLSAMKPSSAVAESIRSLRTSLRFATDKGMPQVMMFTSAAIAEGKTTCAINLATVMAQSGSKVLLIDGDLRKPRLHKEFGIDKTPGLTDHITDFSAESLSQLPIVASGIDRLSLLPAGSPTPNPADMLASSRLTRIVNELQNHYDHVIFDASPILGLADALILARQTEGLIFVSRAGRTSKENFRMSMKRLSQVRAPVLGVVLNAVDIDSPEYAYYSAYYYAYDTDHEDAGDDATVDGQPPPRPMA